MVKKGGEKKGENEKKEFKIEDLGPQEAMPTTYRTLVTRRLTSREGNIMSKLPDMDESHLRFTVRIFADCMEEEDMERFLEGYSEYMVEEQMTVFVEEFVPKYTEYAISELEARKKRSEGFAPDQITGEELQEMAIKEKWPKLAEKPEAFSNLRLRREIAKLALCLRPYMLSDPAWNESLLEFALYFDIQEKLKELSEDEIHHAVMRIAPLVIEADNVKGIKEKEEKLRGVRALVLSLAGIEVDVEELIGPPMERYPREGPEGWELAEFRNNLEKLDIHEVRLSTFVYIELLTLQEMNDLAGPFMEKFESFYEMDKHTLIDLLCVLVSAIGDREILNFFERYSKGKMMIARAFSPETWALIPRDKKLQHLREDNDGMDIAMMARHIARIFMTETFGNLKDYDFQINLIRNPDYMKTQEVLAREVGDGDEGERLRELNDRVTLSMLDLVNSTEGLEERFSGIRRQIASAMGREIS